MVKFQTATFKGDRLEAVDVDGSFFVAVRPICENLGIKGIQDQYQKLKSDPTFEARLIEVPTAGGVQKVFCIPLEKLNGWLFTINPNKVKPEVKQKLIAYKNECFKVLYDHFVAKAQLSCRQNQHMTPQIMAYKANLSKKNKRIEELRWKLAAYNNEIEELKKRQAEEIEALKLLNSISEHNLLDLSGQMACYHKALIEEADILEQQATRLKAAAKNLRKKANTAQFFLDQFLKYYPKSKSIVELAGKTN